MQTPFQRKIMAVTALVLWSFSVTSSTVMADTDDTGPVAIVGAGAMSCKVLNDNPTKYLSLMFIWAQGALSMLNVHLYNDVGDAVNLLADDNSVESQKSYLTNYCLDHPDQTISDGVVELFGEMKRIYLIPGNNSAPDAK